MIAVICAAILAPATYRFDAGATVRYDVEVAFSGYVPVLGGTEGNVEVKMAVEVRGLDPDDQGRPRAVSEIRDFGLFFNEAKMPLGLTNVTDFFPKTTVSYDPSGRVLRSDAPKKNLPVKLPGLEQDRFPEITYLPLELPTGGLEAGTTWSFERKFGNSPIRYEAKATSVTDKQATIDVTIVQEYEVLEDAARNVVEKVDDAEARVSTRLTGKGTGVFDLDRGSFRKLEVASTAIGKVINLKSKATSERRLAITHRIQRRDDPESAP
ncbi:MAG: hypothetical protein KIS66_08120 [Fimbriimonadaceae bacterium]|nr:hypothetical protein [Fimbriimonadaceae bacterium]